MALNAAVVWEVRTDGADTNGGGFKAGASGTDWSQQATAQYSVTDAVTNGTTTITSATANFGTDVVGNLLYITGGTGSITGDWYEITARGSTTSITVDRATGLTTGTGATLKIGGALASPGLAASKHTAGNTIWIKSGTYTISTATPGAGGPVHSTGSAVGLSVRGYTSVRGDDLTWPVLSCSAGSMSVVKLTAGSYNAATDIKLVEKITVDANGQATVVGFELGSAYGGTGGAIRCKAIACATGFLNAAAAPLVSCWASGCTTGFSAASSVDVNATRCLATGGTSGFVCAGAPASVVYAQCLALGCTGVGFTTVGYGGTSFVGCVAHGCGSHGFTRTTYPMGAYVNCVASSNGGYGFDFPAGVATTTAVGCGAYNNTSGATSVTPVPAAVTALAGLPWRGPTADMRPSLTMQQLFNAAAPLLSFAGRTGFMGALSPEYAVPPRTRKGFTR